MRLFSAALATPASWPTSTTRICGLAPYALYSRDETIASSVIVGMMSLSVDRVRLSLRLQ